MHFNFGLKILVTKVELTIPLSFKNVYAFWPSAYFEIQYSIQPYDAESAIFSSSKLLLKSESSILLVGSESNDTLRPTSKDDKVI